MFAIERIKIIKNHITKDRKVSVAKLSELLDVTEVTIRRDLEKLEKEGFLKRTHGGAVIIDYDDEPLELPGTSEEEITLLQEIADMAFVMVEDHETLLLLDGDTNLLIAKRLVKKKGLTVVTNDLRIAMEFQSGSNSNTVIVLGGDLDHHAVFGQMAVDNVQNFTFTHFFVEIDGLSETVGMTVSSIKKATLIQQSMFLAKRITVVCPSNICGEKSLYRIGNANQAHQIITDSKISDYYKNYLFNLNIPLYTSVEIYEG